MVVAEATFMIERAGGPAAEARFLRSLQSPLFQVEVPTTEDLGRAAELVEKYADLPLGGTDASVVALAEPSTRPRSPPSTTGTSRWSAVKSIAEGPSDRQQIVSRPGGNWAEPVDGVG
jgi:hypothetical protein